MLTREFDIILYGATGYTGQLVAEYLQKSYGKSGLRWAMAGRNKSKLEQVRSQIGAPQSVALITANSADAQSLKDMASRTQAVITTVGPYQLYGTHLLAACAELGTDYVDLCGEPAWMHDTVRSYTNLAENSGARIVHSCGFDSIPFDLGVYHLQQAALKKWGQPLRALRGRVRKMNGTFSGGTAASFMTTMNRVSEQPEVLGWLKDPFTLVPAFTGPPQPPGQKPQFEADINSWSAPFIMASINTKNVHRSNAMLGFPYGEDFVYDEMILTGPGEAGETMAKAVAGQNSLMGKDVPKPGEGPSKAEREAGFYDILFIGEGPNVQKLIGSVAGDMDPGYGSTSKMISEAALCLIQDLPRRQKSGGIYTPAAAMGEPLISRLQSRAGLTFKIGA